MNTPNDTGNMWRLDRYVEYYNIRHSQNDGDVHNLGIICQDADLDTKAWMAFLYSTCYSVATTCFLFTHFPSIEYATESRLRQFWAEYKSKLIFQSDRRYVKNMDKFCDIVMSYKEKVAGRRQFEICEELGWNQTAIYKWFTSVYYCGRFSAMLFMEAVYGLMGKPLTQESYLDWNSCKTCSQGLLTISYQDDLVAEVEHRDFTPQEIECLKTTLEYVMRYTQSHLDYPINFSRIIGYLCSYFKLYKQTRYLEYYTDRRLEELLHYKKVFPESPLWDYLFEIRYKNVPHSILGELNGWSGIRKEKCKEFVTYGKIDCNQP